MFTPAGRKPLYLPRHVKYAVKPSPAVIHPTPFDTAVAASMHRILRKRARKHGLPIRLDGYVRLKDLASHQWLDKVDRSILLKLAREDGRFDTVREDGKWLVRVSEGHLMAHVSANNKLLTPEDHSELIFYCKPHRWEEILRDGGVRMPQRVNADRPKEGYAYTPMQDKKINFEFYDPHTIVSFHPEAAPHLGLRLNGPSKTYVLTLSLQKAQEHSIFLFRTLSRRIISEGNAKRFIPLRCFTAVNVIEWDREFIHPALLKSFVKGTPGEHPRFTSEPFIPGHEKEMSQAFAEVRDRQRGFGIAPFDPTRDAAREPGTEDEHVEVGVEEGEVEGEEEAASTEMPDEQEEERELAELQTHLSHFKISDSPP